MRRHAYRHVHRNVLRHAPDLEPLALGSILGNLQIYFGQPFKSISGSFSADLEPLALAARVPRRALGSISGNLQIHFGQFFSDLFWATFRQTSSHSHSRPVYCSAHSVIFWASSDLGRAFESFGGFVTASITSLSTGISVSATVSAKSSSFMGSFLSSSSAAQSACTRLVSSTVTWDPYGHPCWLGVGRATGTFPSEGR